MEKGFKMKNYTGVNSALIKPPKPVMAGLDPEYFKSGHNYRW